MPYAALVPSTFCLLPSALCLMPQCLMPHFTPSSAIMGHGGSADNICLGGGVVNVSVYMTRGQRGWILANCLSMMLAATAAAASPVDFGSQIEPILKKACYDCHSAKRGESGLRLDSVRMMLRGGDRGPAVVAGNASESLLYQAILGTGDVARMPAEGPQLTTQQTALIKRWIEQGAVAPIRDDLEVSFSRSDHWSFQPISRPTVPVSSIEPSGANPIDAFVLDRLRESNIRPSPSADRVTLIRRLSLDLHGLPPTVDQVQQFLADERPGAYERLVDRQLASVRYGERWGRHWLDMARYADSNGYTVDGARSIWKYRDWVVDALNRDLPFDRFAVEQLAGDLLPGATTDQLIATGFHRNTLINQEGGTDAEQFRVDSIYDRVATTGTVFLGLTVGCAQCHSHKFDPISQREYYQLFAVFNDCEEPSIEVPSVEQSAEVERLKAEIAAAEKPLRKHDKQLLIDFDQWVQRVGDTSDTADAWTVLEPTELVTQKGALLTRQDDSSIFVDFSIPPNDVFVVRAEAPASEITAVRLEALTAPTLPKMGPGRASNGNFVLSEFEMIVESGAATARPIRLINAIADHSQRGYPVAQAIDGDIDTVVARIETDTGLSGWGEVCTIPHYLPAYSAGVVPAVRDMSSVLIGAEFTGPEALTALIDGHLPGHLYAKSVVDIALWDLFGKHCNLPLYTLLGGRRSDKLPLYHSITCIAPEEMARMAREAYASGMRQFQIKLGADDDWTADVARFRLVREAVGDGPLVYGDWNCGS